MLELNHLQAGEGDRDDNWSAFIVSTLTVGAEGWCLHEPLRHHGSRTAAILARIEAVGANLVGKELPHADIAHMDFHHRNILQSRDEPVAVIDWEGSMAGDRTFDLVTLGYCAGVSDAEAGVETRIWTQVRRLGDPAAITAYVSHMALRRLDWTIRYHPNQVAYWAQRSEEMLAEFA